MRRRNFIALLGGTAAWPCVALAQNDGRMRRIGVLMGYTENDPEAQVRLMAFKQALKALGWDESRNLQIDLRWAASGEMGYASKFAKELVALRPDVILANTTPVTAALREETKTIPIVFVPVSDPIGEGFVNTLPRPGGNITGFINFEPTIIGKWLDLLKDIAPGLMQVAYIFNPETAPYAENYLQPLETAATKFGVKPIALRVHSESDIEEAFVRLEREPGSAVIVMSDSFMTVHRKAVIEAAIRYKLPFMCFISTVPREGGLISYGVDVTDLFRRSASYVDRILRGANPAELPVQLPTKFELVINLNTAKTLGLTVSRPLLIGADEVIE
jgi:putative tryptophan/tyrosine transport system substrate-binding protein